MNQPVHDLGAVLSKLRSELGTMGVAGACRENQQLPRKRATEAWVEV